MSGTGVHQPGSSETGLTFVRPLPQAEAALHGSSHLRSPASASHDLMARLFPPRNLEDSGSVGPVTGLELGHFVIEERIGRGGMGAVFRAIDRRLDRVVALKVLSAEYSGDPEAVLRFQNEARSAARLDHDNIARVHYIGEENGLHFIAFEFVMGTNIRNFIVQKGRLSPHDAVNYTLQIAEALRQTAAAHVVHRDIKPSNIIISPTGRAKLVDLGLARHNASEASKDLTVAGTTLGTFDYIAPEQAIDARNVDVRTDIYSLGCTLFHMVTGEPPYPKGTMFEKVMNHHRRSPPDASLKNSNVSPQLSRVIQKMMASNPDERYHTPEALINDLMLIAESLGLQPSHPETIVWSTPLFRKRSPLWDATRTWVLAGLGLVLLAFMMDRWSDRTADTPLISPGPQSVSPPEVPGLPVEEVVTTTPIPDSTTTKTVIEPEAGEVDVAANQLEELENAMAGAIQGPAKLLTLQPGPDLAVMTPVPVKTAIPLVEPFVPEAPLKQPFTVLVSGQEPKLFASLQAACVAAPDNSVIEINEDSLLPTQVDSLKLSGKHLKIRPAGNFRPLLKFEISLSPVTSTFSRTAQMITLTHAALELYDMDVQLIVNPESLPDMWTMISLNEESEFLARGCSFTLTNPDQVPGSIFSMPENKIADLVDIMPEPMMLKPSQISLTECVVRGDGDFLFLQSISSARVSLRDVALACSGAMFRVDGSGHFDSAMSQDDSDLLSIQMHQVTGVIGEELLSMTSGNHGAMPFAELDVHDCLFSLKDDERSLISISGHEDYEVLLGKLQWKTHSETNFVQSERTFCRIDSPIILDEIQNLDPESFGVMNTIFVPEEMLMLSRSASPTLLSAVQPNYFKLQQSSNNPALNATSDGRNAGIDWSLSRIPAALPTSR